MENASSQAQHSGGQQGGAQVPLPPKKASSDRGKKQMEMGGGCGGAGRRRRRTLTRAGLHSTTVACVPQQPRRMGIVVGAGPAGIPSAGGSDRIGSELLLHALLGGAARRTAPVLACQWRVGRRAPTRRCVVRSSTGMHACMQKRAVDPMLRPRCAEGQGTGGRSLSVSASASPSSCMDDY
jgi:hypothetical protein